ncbi:MAG TPA: hypothetical protein VL361_03590 [Candidatus Limnocylindrales bacterium]|jgi:hypothetical protein|nr:hypothetical protein [Candidatus Limnocylindrales bacterium]
MKIIFAGSIGRFPVGGHAWIDLQYLLGLRDLGHEVCYLEECGAESCVYHWEREELTSDLQYPTAYLQECLSRFDWGARWIYRAGDTCLGLSLTDFIDVCAEADLLLIRGVPLPLWRPEYLLPRRRAFIDVDPGFTQISMTRQSSLFRNTASRCECLFTIGQRIGAQDCLAPTGDFRWNKTLSPVFLAQWPLAAKDGTHFTTVMQWRSYAEAKHDGRSYGNKNKEFPKFIDLPRQTSQAFRIAVTGAPPGLLQAHGWEVVEGWKASRTLEDYQLFVQQSRAEFCVAKQGYVAAQAGWFSDRSICYLASGRPVLVEDTGLADWLPIGKGIITFGDVREAQLGVEKILNDYPAHQAAGRRLAEEIFASERVLPPLLNTAMN